MSEPDVATLQAWIVDACARCVALVDDLDDAQWVGPQLAGINPPGWELGHVAWFLERWLLCHAGGQPPGRADADALYDSIAVAHARRWSLPLPDRTGTLAYVAQARDRALELLDKGEPTPEQRYHARYGVLHADMHAEAFAWMRQTLGYPAPRLPLVADAPVSSREHRGVDDGVADAGAVDGGAADDGGAVDVADVAIDDVEAGDVAVEGGTYLLGALPDEGFCFDNEKWAHPVALRPFRIARRVVDEGAFAAFTDDGGYARQALWSHAGWAWRQRERRDHPGYWRRDGAGWAVRTFDRWRPLRAAEAMIHVSHHEAEAWCRWAGRRLPSEAEWEAAARTAGAVDGPRLAWPWGDAAPSAAHARLDGRGGWAGPAAGQVAGVGLRGLEGLIGGVWEWTSSPFEPFPGFAPDPYREYSQPWFGAPRVARGGCWMTTTRWVRPGYRNFATPERDDLLYGFRTCAVGD